jgi:hypothetical protein
MAAPLLAALCDNLAQAPTDHCVASAIVALLAALPGTLAEAFKFDLTPTRVRKLGALASTPPVASVLRALAAPPASAPLVAALLPSALRPAGVTPVAEAAIAKVDEARELRQRQAYRATDENTAAEDDAGYAAATLPLWRAAQSARTGRARIALARASTMLRACELRRKRAVDSTITQYRMTAVDGVTHVQMQSDQPFNFSLFTI